MDFQGSSHVNTVNHNSTDTISGIMVLYDEKFKEEKYEPNGKTECIRIEP